MDIYQCLTCGEQWPHGGMRETFIATAQHADQTRFLPEGMHMVVVGERHAVEAQYDRIKAGVEDLPWPDDGHAVSPPTAAERDARWRRRLNPPVVGPPREPTLFELLRDAREDDHATDEELARIAMRFVMRKRKAVPASALDDVLPDGGELTVFSEPEQAVADLAASLREEEKRKQFEPVLPPQDYGW